MKHNCFSKKAPNCSYSCDVDPRPCCVQVLFQDGKFQWKRLENLIALAREGSGGLDLSDTVRDGIRVVLLDEKLRLQLIKALTEDNRLHIPVSSLNRQKQCMWQGDSLTACSHSSQHVHDHLSDSCISSNLDFFCDCCSSEPCSGITMFATRAPGRGCIGSCRKYCECPNFGRRWGMCSKHCETSGFLIDACLSSAQASSSRCCGTCCSLL